MYAVLYKIQIVTVCGFVYLLIFNSSFHMSAGVISFVFSLFKISLKENLGHTLKGHVPIE